MLRQLRLLVCIALVLTATLGVIGPVGYAEEGQDWETATRDRVSQALIMQVDNPVAMVDGQKMQIEPGSRAVKPVVIDGTTLVPVKFITEIYDANLSFDSATGTVEVRLGDKQIVMVLGDRLMRVNGQDNPLAVPAQAIAGRTCIPLRSLIEAIGKSVFYSRGIIIISDQPNIIDLATEAAILDRIIASFSSGQAMIAPVASSPLDVPPHSSQDGWIESGAVVGEGGWLYLANNLDRCRLYRAREDGSELQKLSEDAYVSRITLADGWVYYIALEPERAIVRVNIDTGQRQVVVQDDAQIIRIGGGRLFYSVYRQDEAHIMNAALDGTDLRDMNIADLNTRHFLIADGWLYHSATYRSAGIYRISLADGTVQKLANGEHDLMMAVTRIGDQILIKCGWRAPFTLHLIDAESGEYHYLGETERNHDELLADDDGTLFSTLGGSYGGPLYKGTLEDIDQELLDDRDCHRMSIVNGWLYYQSGPSTRDLFRMRTDGSNMQRWYHNMWVPYKR